MKQEFIWTTITRQMMATTFRITRTLTAVLLLSVILLSCSKENKIKNEDSALVKQAANWYSNQFANHKNYFLIPKTFILIGKRQRSVNQI
jgi:hypothetical protein